MIWTLPAEIAEHSSSEVTIQVIAPDQGIFVRELEIYLGNCQDCAATGLSYTLFFLPLYS